MKKNNFILISILLAGSVACTKKTPQTLLSKWEEKTEDFNSLERKLASSPQGECFQSLYTVPTLKDEVRDLEKKYSAAPKVTGKWKHLDLSKLPVPQANFLKEFGKDIGDQSNPDAIDYSSCEDLPCIFNKIYQKENNVAGYVHYIWYLKFGIYLSADNKVPMTWYPEGKRPAEISMVPGIFNNKNFAVTDYLYKEDELYALWRLSHILKVPQMSLKKLKEMQRAPKSESFEEKEFAGACGLAYSMGWIKLIESCLWLDRGTKDSGYLYHAVTHELSHHVDFEAGRGLPGNKSRSEKDDYLSLAGMTYHEEVNKTTGKLEYEWLITPGTKFVNPFKSTKPYSASSPAENFAETLALFRVWADGTKGDITDEHFKFVSDNFYESKTFLRADMMKLWAKKYQPEADKAILKSVVDCNENGNAAKSMYFKKGDFTSPVLPGMLNCLSAKSEELSKLLAARVKLNEAEGCKVFDEKKENWDDYVKPQIRDSLEKYLQELQKNKDYLAKIQEFQKQVSDKTIARNSYINCYAEADEQACFDAELRKGAFDKALELNLPESQTKDMAEMYIAYHTYESIRSDVLKTYQIMVSSHQEIITKEAEDLWQGCLNINQNDDQTPSGTQFLIGSGYMISSFYNCLNAGVPSSVKNAISDLSVDGLKIQHAKEELILTNEVKPQLVKLLVDTYTREKEKEIKKAADFVSKDNGKLRSDIVSDFTWVKNVVDSAKIQKDCRAEALKRVAFQPLYNMKNDLFGEFIDSKVCSSINNSAEYQKWLDSASGEFQEKFTSGLEDKLFDLGNQKADECLKQYPADTAMNRIRFKRQRESCLVDAWPKIEERVFTEALSDPTVAKFKISSEVLKGKIEANRRVLQLRVMKAKFN